MSEREAWYERHGRDFHSLCELLEAISEDCYCAGWLDDVEHSVWAMLGSKEPVEFGMGSVSLAGLARAKELSKSIGGWARYDQGPSPVPMAEWLERHAQWEQARRPKADAVQFPWARRVVDG